MMLVKRDCSHLPAGAEDSKRTPSASLLPLDTPERLVDLVVTCGVLLG
jgi:hypothetical protein